MTEDDWLTGFQPAALLLGKPVKVSERKLRLFAVACCRRIGARIPDPLSRTALSLAERYADGQATEAERAATARRLRETIRSEAMTSSRRCAREAVWYTTRAGSMLLAMGAARAAATAAEEAVREQLGSAGWNFNIPELHKPIEDEHTAQADLVREVLGNPFRRPELKPYWLAWEDGIVVTLARTIYEESDFERLPILADALEEAGCTAAALLEHCRQPDGHVRGCWVLDQLLGKS
jgi:hypothetical protein